MTSVPTANLQKLEYGRFLETSRSLQGPGFNLRPRVAKVYSPTRALVVFYDVGDTNGAKIGHAHLILEPSAKKVADLGHLCVELAATKTDPALLGAVAGTLVKYAHEMGIETVRIVIPRDAPDKAQACKLAGAVMMDEFSADGKRFVAYEAKMS